MLFNAQPSAFQSQFIAVSCALQWSQNWLFLQRSESSPQPNRWGFPTGKLEEGESLIDGLCREVHEETAIQLNSSTLKRFRTYWVRWPDLDFVYHLYYCDLTDKPTIELNRREHSTFAWLNIQSALKLNLVDDASQILWDLQNQFSHQ